MKPALWAGEAACLVRCGQPRAAMRLLRKAGDALAKGSAPLPERASLDSAEAVAASRVLVDVSLAGDGQ